MKKLFFFMAAFVAAMATTTLTSCSSDETENEVKDPTERYSNLLPVTLKDAPFAQSAKKYAVPTESGIKSLEITESGYCIVETAANEVRTRAASGATNILMGTCKLNDKGEIEAQVGSYKITIPIIQGALIAINGKSYTVEVEASDIASSTSTTNLCRSWEPVSYHAYIMSNGKIYYNKVESNIMSLQRDLFKYILGSEPKERNYIIKNDIKDLLFTKAGSFAMNYKNGGAETKAWNWDIEKDALLINNSDGGKFLSASTKFSGNTMYLFIDVSIDVKSDAIDVDAVDAKLVVTLNSK